MLEVLSTHGLQQVGRWIESRYASVAHLRDSVPFGIGFELEPEWLTRRNIVYAFVVSARVRYIGETSAGASSRFQGYRYGNTLETDVDNRVKLAITCAIRDGCEVSIWAAAPEAELKLPSGDSLRIPGSKPLEEHLIALIDPDLNVKKLHKQAPA